MPEGGHDGAWYCGRRPHFDDDGMRNFCPPEGCPKGYCAKDDGWKEGDATPDRCLGIQPAAQVGEHLAVAKGGGRSAFQTAMVDAARARGGAGAEFIAKGESNLWLDIAYDAFAALAERPAMPMPDRGLFQAAANIVYRIEAAGRLSYEADNFERWKADARDLAPRLRLALLSQDRGEGVEEAAQRDRAKILSDALDSDHKPKVGEGDYDYLPLAQLPHALREQAKEALFFECEPHVIVDAWNIVQMAANELEARIATLPSPASGGGGLESAIASIPGEAFWLVGHDGEGADPATFKARIFDPMTMRTPLEGWGETPAQAIRAALDSQQEKG